MQYSKMIFFLLSLTTLGCGSYPLSGKLVMKDPSLKHTVYLVDPVNFSSLASSFEGRVIDSTNTGKDGFFHFNSMPANVPRHIYLITVQRTGEKFANKLNNEDPSDANYLPFIYEPGKKVVIYADAASMQETAAISGTVSDNGVMEQLAHARVRLFKKYLSLKNEPDESNLMEHETARYNFQKELKSTADSLNHFLGSMLALRWMSPEGDYERIPEFVKGECSKWNATSYISHVWLGQLCARAKTLPPVPGEKFPDFTLPLLHGDSISGSSFIGAKLTLVDLWASWCAPCRRENTSTLVPLWDKYHNEGFRIIGYALDSSSKGLENAIAKDGVGKWPQASHLQGDVSPFFERLKISTIPANYLLDDHGIIVAKNLHGQVLTEFVTGYMSEK